MDKEQLHLEYLRIKDERDLHLNDEKNALKKALECEKKVKILKKDIEEIKEDNSNEKLLESALFIKQYCERTICNNCMFYTSTGMYEGCRFSEECPANWQI